MNVGEVNEDIDLTLEPPYLIIKPFVSEEQFYRDADEDSNWEYLDGRLLMHSPASDRHEDLFSVLMTLVRSYVDVRGPAIVRGLSLSDAARSTLVARASPAGRPP